MRIPHVDLATLLWQVAPAVREAAASGADVWPVTVAGWVTLVGGGIGLLVSIIGSIIAYGKFLGKLNGFGERLGTVEKEQAAAKERDEVLTRALDRMTQAQEGLLEKLGHAERASEQCEDSMQGYTIKIGAEIHDLAKLIQHEGREAGERLKGVETKLDFIMRERDDRYRRADP